MSSASDRRDFLAQLASASLAVAGGVVATACAGGRGAVAAAPAPVASAAASGAPPAPPAKQTFDDSWTARVAAAKHKAVFDSPDVEDGRALFQASTFRDGYVQALGAAAADAVPVIVLRHLATVLAFDDAVWAKYPVARTFKIRPPDASKKAPWPDHNPFSRPHADAEKEFASYMLEGALASGVVVLACNRAFMGLTAQLAQESKTDVAVVRQEAKAGMIKGVVLQPSGIYATLRAQEVGCTFMRS